MRLALNRKVLAIPFDQYLRSWAIHVFDDHYKLVAAEAPFQIVQTKAFFYTFSNRLDNFITKAVAKCIIRPLELIEIQDNHRMGLECFPIPVCSGAEPLGLPIFQGMLEQLCSFFEHGGFVEQACQLITLGALA